jgi:hypothetical protein
MSKKLGLHKDSFDYIDPIARKQKAESLLKIKNLYQSIDTVEEEEGSTRDNMGLSTNSFNRNP